MIHRSPLGNLAKSLARPLSRIATAGPLLNACRYTDAYLNALLGRGAGTGWDLAGEVAAAVSVITTPTPVVLDVGANVGQWTRLLLHRLPGARVTMFEPARDCHARISAAVGERARLVDCALGEANGRARLWSSKIADWSASLHPRRDSYFARRSYDSIEVEVVTLDSWLDRERIALVDFMKLDTEGHELSVLQGAKHALANRQIRALSFEFGSANINSRTFFHDFWDLLSPRYRLMCITPGGRLLPVQSYYEDLEYFRGVSNYVAVCV